MYRLHCSQSKSCCLSFFFFFFFADELLSAVAAAAASASVSVFITALSLFRFFFFGLKTSTLFSTFTETLSPSTALALCRLFFLDVFSASAHYLAEKKLNWNSHHNDGNSIL